MKIKPIMVSFWSLKFIFKAIDSLIEHCSNLEKILVVDNNPDEEGFVGNVNISGNFIDYSLFSCAPQGFACCRKESRRLQKNSRIDYFKNPLPDYKTHGKALDLGLEWAKLRGYTHILLLEPDIEVTSDVWLKNMIKGAEEGFSLVGINFSISGLTSVGPMHVCPSLWKIEDVEHTFDLIEKKPGENEFLYYRDEIGNPLWEPGNPQLNLLPQFDWRRRWDTGQKNWYEIAKKDKMKFVDGEGFNHIWHGTYHSYCLRMM